MKKIAFITTLLFLFFSNLPLWSQVALSDEILSQSWGTVENMNRGALQNICHRFGLVFSDEEKGLLSVEIIFLGNDEQRTLHYHGFAPFTYQVLEEDTFARQSYRIEVAYQDVEFNFQEAPKYNEHLIPPDQLSYIEELKDYLSGREEEYEITLEGNAFLVFNGFSLIKNNLYTYFQHGGLSNDPCRNLIRN